MSGTDLDIRPSGAAIALSADPQGALDFAVRTASILKSVLQRANLIVSIQGREHILAEGWTLLGAMTNHTPRIAWSRRVLDSDIGEGWEARAEVVDANGVVVSAAEAMALHAEQDSARSRSWTREHYSMRSMAQTRAASKAMRLRLGFIVALAGLETTPAEEMPDVVGEPSARPAQRRPAGKSRKALAEERRAELEKRALSLGVSDMREFFTAHGVDNPDLLADDRKYEAAKSALDALGLDANTSEQAEAALPGDGEQTTIDEERPIGAPAYGREPS